MQVPGSKYQRNCSTFIGKLFIVLFNSKLKIFGDTQGKQICADSIYTYFNDFDWLFGVNDLFFGTGYIAAIADSYKLRFHQESQVNQRILF